VPFDFERLDVYNVAIEFVAVANAIKRRLPEGYADLADQLQRAATSIVLNIAEGAGEYSRAEKARFYRFARRSAFECAAVLDIMLKLHLADATEASNGRDLLDRIGAMLTKMATQLEKPGSGSGSGSGSV